MSLAQTLESFLSDRHIPYTTELHPVSTSSLATAHSAHVDEECLAKSVLLGDDRGFVLAVLPAGSVTGAAGLPIASTRRPVRLR